MKRTMVFLPALLLGAGVLLVSGIREQHIVQPAKPMKALPAAILGYSARDIVIDEAERKIAGMSDYAMREFSRADSATPFSVYVGYYDRQVQGKTIHSPKNCLPGAGWDVLSATRVPLGGKAGAPGVNRVLLANQGVRALVLYWYQGRGRIESSEYRVKWDLLRDAAMYGRTEEALVRVVVVVPPAPNNAPGSDKDPAVLDADRLAQRVAADLVNDVDAVLPVLPRG